MTRNGQSIGEQVSSLMGTIEEGIKKCKDSEEYKKLLMIKSKMPTYSFNNCLLIMAQTKGKATMVASYGAWKSINRYVKKAEKAIKILAPNPYKKTIEREMKDSEGHTLYKEGQPVMETVEVKMLGFKPVSVFDISATDGEPIPELTHRLKGGVSGYTELRAAIEAVSPVLITIGHVDGSANGYYSSSSQKIVVSDKLEPKQQIKTMLHELAHAYLDKEGLDDKRTREEKETEAESVSFILMNRLLGDQVTPDMVGEYSFGYLAGWGDEQLTEFKSCLDVIQKVSTRLIQQIEDRWELIIKEQQNQVEQQTKSLQQVKVASDELVLTI